jgi:hypothetical protein
MGPTIGCRAAARGRIPAQLSTSVAPASAGQRLMPSASSLAVVAFRAGHRQSRAETWSRRRHARHRAGPRRCRRGTGLAGHPAAAKRAPAALPAPLRPSRLAVCLPGQNCHDRRRSPPCRATRSSGPATASLLGNLAALALTPCCQRRQQCSRVHPRAQRIKIISQCLRTWARHRASPSRMFHRASVPAQFSPAAVASCGVRPAACPYRWASAAHSVDSHRKFRLASSSASISVCRQA